MFYAQSGGYRMSHYREIAWDDAAIYDDVEMKVIVSEIYEVVIKDLSGITFRRKSVEPTVKDFTTWAVLCHHTPRVNMLEGRDDLGVLWDIRVASGYKRLGVGQHLFDAIRDKAMALGLKQLKIECQNSNVPAVRFYLKQGAHIGAMSKYAYFKEKDIADEVQLLLYLDLSGESTGEKISPTKPQDVNDLFCT